MGRILALTGVTGNKSGKVLIEQLLSNLERIKAMFPDGVRILIRSTSNIQTISAVLPDAEICVCDFENKESLIKCLTEVDTVIHIAGIQRSKMIVDASGVCQVRRLILVHTTGIYSKYKAAGEEYRNIDEYVYRKCKENNIILTICRPTMIYGNIYDNNVIIFVKMVDKLPIMPVVNGAKYELQPVHYADLGKAYYQILVNEETTANKDYNLSGGSAIMLRDMLKIIGKNLGKKVRFISCPFPVAYVGAWVIYCVTFGKKDFRENVQRLCEPRIFSYKEATLAFDYNPMTFEEGIVNEIKEYKKEKVTKV